MEIMMMLEGPAIEQLRAEFEAKGEDGLLIDEFVEKMLLHLPGEVQHNKEKLVSELCELFAEIDVNGDGSMEWDEFTSYCVESGLVATRHVTVPLRYRYAENTKFRDVTSHGSFVRRVRWLPELQRLLSFEAESAVVKMYNAELRLVQSLDLDKELPQTERLRGEAGRQLEVHNAALVKKHNVLVVSASDLSLTFWDLGTMTLRARAPTKTTQTSLCWDELGGTLYSAGSSPVVTMWDPLTAMTTGTLPRVHHDSVTDLIAIPNHELLASASLDHTIQLYELTTHKERGELRGHTRGVMRLAYSTEHDVLFSAGFEYDAMAWDLSSRHIIAQLQGHRTSLVGIELVPPIDIHGHERALTADAHGNFKLWDIQPSRMTCLQSFSTASTLAKFTPRSIAVLSPKMDMVAAGCKLHSFRASKVAKADDAPVEAIFNETSMTFVTAAGRHVKIWDACTGKLKNELFDVTGSELTAMCLDDRQRKLILGDHNGEVCVLNYLNGMRMKDTGEPPHRSDVVALMYSASRNA